MSTDGSPARSIKAVFFDFGGVLAEEGFRQGLMAIGRDSGLDPHVFFETATRLIYETGYVIGEADEKAYWDSIRRETGIEGAHDELRAQLLGRFILRPRMLEIVRRLKAEVGMVCILSDQTNWLDELDEKHGFFVEFDRVFNSYHLGKGKTDSDLFSEVAAELGLAPEDVLFIDDNRGHVDRARSVGMKAFFFSSVEALERELSDLGFQPTAALPNPVRT